MINIVTLGYPGHGKTTYINSLCLALENLGKIIPNAFHQYMDQYTLDMVRKARLESQNNDVPRSTEVRSSIPPLSVKLNISGNEFDLNIYNLEDHILDQYNYDFLDRSGIIKEATVFWLFISLKDLKNDGRSLTDTLHVILPVFDRLEIPTLGLKLAVVYTKVEGILNELPTEVANYIVTDPYASLNTKPSDKFPVFKKEDYVKNSEEISLVLSQYTQNHLHGGLAFTNFAEARGIELSFFAVAPLGEKIAKTTILPNIKSHRVIDPLLWALESAPVGHIDVKSPSYSARPKPIYSEKFDQETIFISYKRLDWDDFVKPLLSRLDSAGLKYWVDQHLIEGGEDWFDEINRALRICDRMILCVSPAALESRHVKLEYRYFFNNEKKLYPLICREVSLPAELQTIQYYQYDHLDNLIKQLLKK